MTVLGCLAGSRGRLRYYESIEITSSHFLNRRIDGSPRVQGACRLNGDLNQATIRGMKPALKAAAFLVLLFAIPIIPFVWLGDSFEQSLLDALRQPRSPGVVSAWVIGLLAADMFLPVPSSAVITYAGGVLGIVWGTLVAWVGLSVGAVGGFWLARRFGEPLARWFSDADDVVRMGDYARRRGPAAIYLTRALPILAEACILMLGAGRLEWSRFLGPMFISNGLLALTYSACGTWFRDSNSFPIAIVASGAIPLIVALVLRRWWKPTRS